MMASFLKNRTQYFQVPEDFAKVIFKRCYLKEYKILSKMRDRRIFYDLPLKVTSIINFRKAFSNYFVGEAKRPA